MRTPDLIAAALLVLSACGNAGSEQVGAVDTVFQWIGPDHKIVVEAYDDPKVAGVTCYVSRAKTGGIKGGLGLAEDKSEASIACRQTGPISLPARLPESETVFSEDTSLVFKETRIVRLFDKDNNTLVYLAISRKLIDGAPANSISTVPVMPWGTR